MKKIYFIIVLFFACNIFGQINIEYLNDVPESFKKQYFSKPRIYNPLQVGNTWEYYFEDFQFPFYRTTSVVKDSLINGIKYFKKISYQIKSDPQSPLFVSWERNDTVSGVSFMLDFQDVNENGDYLDELQLDSLENPYWSRYKTFKYSYFDNTLWSGTKNVLVKDTFWVKIDGDTLISRYFEILELFWGEEITDKIGVISLNTESPNRYLTGAIIDGKQYGTIVGVKDEVKSILPDDIYLFQNYPNPFNPTTTIEYSIPANVKSETANGFIPSGVEGENVILKVYDILGREVAILVNKKQKPGNYEVKWNASDFRSGIYFYRLKVGDFLETKKMLLLK